jgi:elongation factor G
MGVTELLDVITALAPIPGGFADGVKHEGRGGHDPADPNGPLDRPSLQDAHRSRSCRSSASYGSSRELSNAIRRWRPPPRAAASRWGPFSRSKGSETHPVEEAGPGEIVAVAKMEELHTGTSFGDYEFPRSSFPRPWSAWRSCRRPAATKRNCPERLAKIVEEDPTIRLDRDSQTKELVMTGMSELHLTLLQERLARRDKLEVETKEPKIPFRETIQANAEGMYRHKKQSGGRGQFGEVHIRMYPAPSRHEDRRVPDQVAISFPEDPPLRSRPQFLWVDSVVGGTIPGNFMPAVEKGFKDRLSSGRHRGLPGPGPLCGSPLWQAPPGG